MGAQLLDSILAEAPEEARESLEAALASVNFTNIALGTLEVNIFERTIEAIDAQFAEQPLIRAQLLQSVASTLWSLGLLEMSTDPQERAMTIRRNELGDDHPDTLHSINNMGYLLRRQGMLVEAEPYYREALEGFRRVLGDDHQETLSSIGNMGVLLKNQDKLAEAEPYYRESLEGRRRVLGNDHQATLISINNMGALLESQGKLAEAEVYNRESLEGSRRVLGDDHPGTLIAIGNMGNLLKSQGKLAEAEAYYRQALEGHRRTLGDDHQNTLISASNLALLLAELDRGAEALVLIEEAIATGRRVLGADHWFIGNFNGKRGRALQGLGRFAEAESAMLEAHGLLVAERGESNGQTTRVAKSLADLYDEWHEAEPGAGHDAQADQWRGDDED